MHVLPYPLHNPERELGIAITLAHCANPELVQYGTPSRLHRKTLGCQAALTTHLLLLLSQQSLHYLPRFFVVSPPALRLASLPSIKHAPFLCYSHSGPSLNLLAVAVAVGGRIPRSAYSRCNPR
jgi:hypothetical protein